MFARWNVFLGFLKNLLHVVLLLQICARCTSCPEFQCSCSRRRTCALLPLDSQSSDFHPKMFLPSFQGNSCRNCCHLPIFQKTPPFYTAQKTKNVHEFSAPKANIDVLMLELGCAVSSPLAQPCKAWMPLHRFMSLLPK